MSLDALLNKICRLLKKWLFLTLRFPSLSGAHIECLFEAANKQKWQQTNDDDDDDDKRIILANSSEASKWPTLLIVSTFFLYASKSTIIVLMAYSMYDHYNIEANLIRGPDGMYQFACLQTNCTQLSARLNDVATTTTTTTTTQLLARDFIKLPLFTICKSEFPSLLSSPTSQLDSFGVFVLTMSAFYVFFLSVWSPLEQLVSPANEDTFMFMSAPQVYIQLMRFNCKRLLFDLRVSLKNYLINHQQRACKGATNSNSCQLDQLENDDDDDDDHGHEQQLIDDCMPSIRSNWWHSIQIRSFCLQFVTMSLVIISMCATFLALLSVKCQRKSREMLEIQRFTELTNCKLWHPIDGGGHRVNYVNLAELRLGWSLGFCLEAAAFNFLPGFTAALLAIDYVLIYSELSCWLAELQSYLLVCLTCCRFEKSCQWRAAIGSHHSARAHYYSMRATEFSMAKMRQEFRQQVEVIGILLFKRTRGKRYTINSDLDEAILMENIQTKLKQFASAVDEGGWSVAREQQSSCSWALELVDQRPIINDYSSHLEAAAAAAAADELSVETVEKVYIQYRLFMDYVHNLTPCLTLYASLIYILTYGLVFVGVFFSSHVRSLTVEPVVMIVAGWMTAPFFILLAANFHANTKRLQRQIWSLIAQLAGSENLRIRHLCQLWTRQMFVLDKEGDGIALKAYAIRITYVNLIQIFIWSGTILVIALKPY